MKSKRPFFTMYGVLPVLVLTALLLTACGSAGVSVNNGTLTICHATNDEVTPYLETIVDFDELTTHLDHPGDIFQAPGDGCPTVLTAGDNAGKLTYCHATGSTKNPYQEITTDFNGLRGHRNHAEDVIPAPENGCRSIMLKSGPPRP